MSSYLSRDMQMVAEVLGEEAARRLMAELGGMYLYIPKASSEAIAEMLKTNGYDAKEVAAKLRVSLSRVYKILRALRKEQRGRQLELF